MTRVAGGRNRIEEHIEGLERMYDSFPVHQTTVPLASEQYERVCESGDDIVDAYVEVRNDDCEVLHVEDDGGVALPGGTVDLSAQVETQIRETVRERTGIDCLVDGVDRATIAGLRNEDDPDGETIYRLVVVFDCHYESGSAVADARWERELEASGQIYA